MTEHTPKHKIQNFSRVIGRHCVVLLYQRTEESKIYTHAIWAYN